MKKSLIAVALALLPVFSFAGNTINFQGEVSSQTCSVNINGNTSAAAPVVLLPTVPATLLATAGDVAGATPFNIGVSGCTAGASALTIKTIFIGNNVNGSGRLGNMGTAGQVSLRLVDPTAPGTPLDLTGGAGNAGLVLGANQTSASYNFQVEYYAEGTATPGSVIGSVQYALSYM
jgi:major type 1 subunit fimbrin (pilin)